MKFYLILLLLISFNSKSYSQIDSIHEKIIKNYKFWQPIIEKEISNSEQLYNYAWGKNFEFNKWFNRQIENDTLTLSEKISIIENPDLGTFLYAEEFSYSGDWYIFSENYYDLKNRLYFIKWNMNTFYAEEPVTVERKLYFDKKGNKIDETETVYKMNTKEKTDLTYYNKDVYFDIIFDRSNYSFSSNNKK